MNRSQKVALASTAVIAALVGIGLISDRHSSRDSFVRTAAAPASKSAAGGASSNFYANGAVAAPDPGALSVESPPAQSPTKVDLTKAKRSDPQIIHTAEVTIQAKNVQDALQRATAVVQRAGGDVFSDNANLDSANNAHVVFKVPPAQFDAVMHQLGTVGKILHSSTNTEDVTGQVVDLDARLTAARASADRVRDLLAKTGSVSDLLGVEQALTEREANVDSLAAQKAALAGQVDFATITVDLSASPAPTSSPRASHDIPGFLDGFRTGFAALLNGLLIVATALGFALPFLVLGAVVLVPVLAFRRRRQPEPAAI